MPTHALAGRIAAVRGELGRLRRKLPQAGGPTREMAAAYYLEQAIRNCKRAEEAWDEQPAKDP